MAITLGEAILYLRGDGSGLDKSLRDADSNARGVIGGLTSFANTGFTGLKKAVGVGLVAGIGAATAGIAALGAGLVGAVRAGSDVEEMMGKFSIVFANTGGRVTDQLDEFGRAVGRNKYELREMAATFGDTLKPMGFSEDAAADFSVQLSKLAVDLGSFNNMDTDEALRRLQGTLIGSHENALAFGVVINENTLKAEMAANGWDKLTGAELEQAKVQARINLLMKGTTDAQGDAARTSGGWANQMRRLQSVLQETQAEIGTKLLPVLTPLLTKLGDLATQYAPQAIDAFTRILDQVVAFAVALLSWDTAAIPFLGTLTEMTGRIMEMIQPVMDAIASFVSWQDVLIALGVVVAAVVLPILAGIVSAALPIIAIGAALVGAVALVRNAWEKDWGGIRTALTSWWTDTGKPIFDQLQVWLAEKLPVALSTLQKFWEDRLLPALRSVWTFIQDNIIPLFAVLIDVWFAAMRAQIALLQAAWENVLLPALRAVWQFIDQNVIPIFRGLSDSVGGVSSVIQTVIEWLGKLADKLNSIDFSNPFSGWQLPSLNIPGFAMGTNFAPGGMALVGEQGPELVSLPRGSRVDNASRTAQQLAAAGATYGPMTVNVYGVPDAPAVARAVDNALTLRRRRGGM
jgi:phage-related minor tail protein